MAKGDALDRKGLIEEAYKIDGITAAECRSIFLDWALSYDGEAAEGIAAVIEKHSDEPLLFHLDLNDRIDNNLVRAKFSPRKKMITIIADRF